VAGIEVEDANDEVVGMICVNPETEASKTVLVVSEKGFGKRTPMDEYRYTNRGGKGVKTINVTDKTGPLVGILDVAETEDIMITCKSGVTIRMPVSGISEQGRATQGVKLIRLDEGDEIAAITQLDDQAAQNGNGENGGHITAASEEGAIDTGTGSPDEDNATQTGENPSVDGDEATGDGTPDIDDMPGVD
jgi:DNA gyrase subunit A